MSSVVNKRIGDNMPKKVDYPHCSFEDALKIAKIVDKVGGRAALE
jgi:hypothetical protein